MSSPTPPPPDSVEMVETVEGRQGRGQLVLGDAVDSDDVSDFSPTARALAESEHESKQITTSVPEKTTNNTPETEHQSKNKPVHEMNETRIVTGVLGTKAAPVPSSTSHPHQPAAFLSNAVTTSQYTTNPFSIHFFLYKNLYQQFQRKANIYFLVISMLQLVPGLSPTGRFTTLMTLVTVLTFSAIKSAYEDHLRHKSDGEVNARPTEIYDLDPTNSVSPHICRYDEVMVGNLVRVKNGEEFPCDLVILYAASSVSTALPTTTKRPGSARHLQKRPSLVGIADGGSDATHKSLVFEVPPERIFSETDTFYVETANLDGETNLKAKAVLSGLGFQVHPETAKFTNSKDDIRALHVECETPNRHIYQFSGNARTQATGSSDVSIVPSNVALRGCRLRKVDYIIGLSVFTGHETKVFMNARQAPHKMSHIERRVNQFLFAVLATQLIMCIISTSVYVSLQTTRKDQWFLSIDDDSMPAIDVIKTFATTLILFNNLIPISLYVSLEMIRFLQGRFLELDLNMYHTVRDLPMIARTTNINEELGQVHYVFSDKTGTLTCNVMKFMKFAVCGTAYGKGITEVGMAAAARKGLYVEDERPPHVIAQQEAMTVQCWDPRINDGAWMSLPDARHTEMTHELFLMMAVCHTVVTDDTKRTDPTKPYFEAESPDELALVEAAHYFGFTFETRRRTARTHSGSTVHLTVKTSKGGDFEAQIYEVIATFEFTHDRKRMSVLVRRPDSSVVLFTKGADSAVMELLKKDSTTTPEIEQTSSLLASFGNDGLRTLLFARRNITSTVFDEWYSRYLTATLDLSKDQADKLRVLYSELEVDMELVGSSAIEDKLQDRVPLTISNLRRADISVWMLTGDKQETAINISFACALLTSDMTWAILSDVHDLDKYIGPHAAPIDGVVMDGTFLAHALHATKDHEAIRRRLYEVVCQCSTVVCCRVSPRQKADVVELVRSFDHEAITLAIGDGANDVPMIQAAHVGVGISGMEGQQAANSADFAIGQFQYLQRLILVHGFANYTRLTKVINYFFYKNAIVIFTQFFFLVLNGWSSQSLYESWSLAMYNVLFTALPCLVVGVLDRPVLNTDHLLNHPETYTEKGDQFTLRNFLLWFGYAIVHAAALFFMFFMTTDTCEYSLDERGTALYTSVILVVTIVLAVVVDSWSWVHWMFVGASLLAWVVFLPVYGELGVLGTAFPLYRVSHHLVETPYWAFMCLVLTLITVMSKDFFVLYYEWQWRDIMHAPWLVIARLGDSLDPFAASRYSEYGHKGNDEVLDILAQTSGNQARGQLVGNKDAETNDRASWLDTTNALFGKIRSFRLTFVSEELERTFIYNYLGNMQRYQIALGIMSVCSVLITLAGIGGESSTFETGMWAVFAVCGCFGWRCVYMLHIKHYVHPLILSISIVGFSALSIANFAGSRDDPDTHPLTFGVMMLGVVMLCRPPFVDAISYILVAFASFLFWYTLLPVSEWSAWDFLARTAETAVTGIMGLMMLHNGEREARAAFIASCHLDNEAQAMRRAEVRSLQLLENVLPRAIVAEIRANNRSFEEFAVGFSNVSVLQSDVVGFTRMSSSMSTTGVVEMMNALFTRFDAMCTDLGLEKIKTIGDAYVCAGGVPIPDNRHPQRIADMGLGMHDVVNEFNVAHNRKDDMIVTLRIGIATGPVNAGIVGSQKICYDIFGPGMHQAEKMETAGIPGRVHCDPSIVGAIYEKFEVEYITTQAMSPANADDDDHKVVLVNGPHMLSEDYKRNGRYFLVRRRADVHEIESECGHEDADATPAMPLTDLTKIDHKLREIIERRAGESGGLNGQLTIHKDVDEVGEFLEESETHSEPDDIAAKLGHKSSFRSRSSHPTHTMSVPSKVETMSLHEGQKTQVVSMSGRGAPAAAARFEDRNYNFHKFTLRMFAQKDEEEFVSTLQNMADERVMLDSFLALFTAFMITFFSLLNFSSLASDGAGISNIAESLYVLLSVIMIVTQCIGFALALYQGKDRPKPWYRPFHIATVLIMLVIAFLFVAIVREERAGSTVGCFMWMAIMLYVFSSLHFTFPIKAVVGCITYFGLVILIIASRYAVGEFSAGKDLAAIFAVTLAAALSMYGARLQEKNVRVTFIHDRLVKKSQVQTERTLKMSDDLLLNVLPRSVLNRMMDNKEQGEILDNVEEATVMFVYFKQDLETTRTHDKNEGALRMILAMNDFLSLIDTLTLEHGAEKIKTHPFLVVSGCPEPRADHVACIINLAVAIQRAVRAYPVNIDVRIGVHTGPVSAGVLGSSKFLYDVFGDSVNMASRLAASGKVGSIHCSEQTARLIDALEELKAYSTERREGEPIYLKGKGNVVTYEVQF
eukprot:PhM_4_TR1332/c0_g1_i1/m.48657/K14802/DRS2, ATP8A; phospholipid-transporting ATPase